MNPAPYQYTFRLTARDWDAVQPGLRHHFPGPYAGMLVNDMGFWNLLKDQVSEANGGSSMKGRREGVILRRSAVEAPPWLRRPSRERRLTMRSRTPLLILVLSLLAVPLVVEAQPARTVPRVGYLEAGSLSAHPLEAFRQGLRELGYREGQNIIIEYRAAEGKPERLAALAADLARLGVDVIFAVSPPAIHAAKNATRTIPIVFVGAADPVISGFVASLARPGANLTGLTLLGPELSGKRLELLKEAVPGLSRVAVLWNQGNPAAASMLKETEAAAGALSVELQASGVRDPAGLDRAFSAMTRERAAAVVVLPDAMLHSQKRRIVALAAKSRLPAIYYAKDYVEAGGLMAYGASFPDLFRRSATHVDKILKGAKPADLPVEQPTKFELVINAKTAKTLGLTIPQSVLLRADQVIE